MKRLITLFWRWWYRCHPEPSKFTKEEALERAKEFGLYDEVATAMGFGLSPDEALQDWDIYPYNK